MMSRAGQVVTREEILSEVWNDPSMKTSKTLDMHMSWLRRKLAGQEPAGSLGSRTGRRSSGSPPCGASASGSKRIRAGPPMRLPP